MIVSSTQTTPVVKRSISDSEKAGLNYDSFLKLMLQQLKSQDPLNPVDQTQSLAQLAQFTNVEQAIKLNQKLDVLLKQSSVSDAAALIGKTVQPTDGTAGGIVQAVEITAEGARAILADGRQISLSVGLRIAGSA